MSVVYGVSLLFSKHFLRTKLIRINLLESTKMNSRLNKIITSSKLSSCTCQLILSTPLVRGFTTEFEKYKNYKQKKENMNLYNSDFDEDEEELKKRRDNNWMRMKITLISLSTALGLAGVYVIYTLGSPKKDESGNVVEDEFTTLPLPQQFLKRMLREIDYLNKMMRQPITNKLLPDTVPPPYEQPKYTLILEISDLLVHADWTYQTGWRFKKRPGVDKFLELVTYPLFELVVFSNEQGAASFPLIEALDPNGYIQFRLGRESTQFFDGFYVKNLDCLNRDLSKVIMVDWSEHSVKFHRDNAVIIPRWTGQDDDTTLVDLAVFLRTIAASDVEDVREVLSYYSKFDNPIETFRENQRKLLEHLEEKEEKERQKETSLAAKWANTFLKNTSRVNIK